MTGADWILTILLVIYGIAGWAVVDCINHFGVPQRFHTLRRVMNWLRWLAAFIAAEWAYETLSHNVFLWGLNV